MFAAATFAAFVAVTSSAQESRPGRGPQAFRDPQGDAQLR